KVQGPPLIEATRTSRIRPIAEYGNTQPHQLIGVPMIAPHHQTRHAPRPGLQDSKITHATLVASTIVIHDQHIPRQGFLHGLQENVYTSSMAGGQDPTGDTHFRHQRMYAGW